MKINKRLKELAMNESIKSTPKKLKEEYYTDERCDKIWDILVEYEYFTPEELKLVTNINGYNEDTLNDCMYARYAMHDIEQLLHEDGMDDVYDEFFGEEESLKEEEVKKPKREIEKKADKLPDDVYTLVYDSLFPVNMFFTTTIAPNIPTYETEQYESEGISIYDIGVRIDEKEDARKAVEVAKELKLPATIKPRPNGGFVVIIKIGKDIAEMDAKEYLEKIGHSTKVRGNNPNRPINKR